MATVYLGRWSGGSGFKKVVAVKALHPHLAGDHRLRDMLRDETRIVARIRHPGVLPTVDVIERNGEVFMVMEYVHGATLSQLDRAAQRHGDRIGVDVSLSILSDALHGLHAAHEARDGDGRLLEIVHRDVSPQNIIVGVDGVALVIDFGVAHATGRITSTRTGEIKGKMSYLAPEQLTDAGISRRTDVYGASVVLWQALTGRKLFDEKNFSQLATSILRSRIDPPSQFAEGISSELDAIVLKGLDRDPSRRFATAQDMAEALDSLGEHASRRRVGTWVRHTARARLDEMATLVKAVEHAAPLPAWGARPRAISLIDPEEIELSETLLSQPSRTQLTSLADATPTPQQGSAFQWVAVLGIAALAGAIWFSALHGSAPSVPAQMPVEPTAMAIPSPPPPAAPPAISAVPSARPVATSSASPSTSTSAAPSVKPPTRQHRQIWPSRKLPKPWIPDGI
jgi:serine/threonine-protein kinase